MDILSFVIDYWKMLPIIKALVYDNGSTDVTYCANNYIIALINVKNWSDFLSFQFFFVHLQKKN